MSVTQSVDSVLSSKLKIPLFLALIVVGLVGNYFKYPIFLNINFLFGSIFAMLALQFFGLGRGIVAAAIIASYTYILWNHPYAIIIQAAEVMVVGWLYSRRKASLVMADMLFWLIVGMPLVYLLYHVVMHIPNTSAYLTMTKQAMNGIFNALVARLIFIVYALRTRTFLISYREIFNNLLTLFVLCPSLILMMIGSRTDFSETDLRIRSSLIQEVLERSCRLTKWVESRKKVALTLADMAVSRTPLEMQTPLEQVIKSDDNFLRIGIQDKDATVVAYFPLIDELGKKNIGKNFADRPYYPVLKQSRKPMLSEVVMGRIGVPKPFVAMLAPVTLHGEYGGCVTGILNLEKVREDLDKSAWNGMLYTLLDINGNVIMTTRTDQKVMAPFTREKGTLNRLDSSVSQWIPTLPPNTPASERWKKSFYVAETGIGSLGEWKLILEQPVAPFQKAIFDNYTGKFIQLFLTLLVALAISEYLSRRLISTHETLQKVSRDLPTKVATSLMIDWPKSGIMEINNLVSNFMETTDSLAAMFYEIQQINLSLEQRIDARTNELGNLMHEVNIILENAPIGIAKVVDRKIVWTNYKMGEIFNYSKNELEGQLTRKLYPSEEAFEKLAMEAYPLLLQGLVFDVERELVSKDGVQIQIRFIGKALDPTDMRKGTIWLLEDITRRKQEEAEKRAFEHQFQETQRLESLGVLAGGIAHDFNNLLAIIIGHCSLAVMNPEKFETNIAAIQNASERAAALCRQMLEYAGHTQIAKSQINMRALVSDMVELLSSTGHKNISIKTVIAPNIPSIHGDGSQIKQILMNLITNATEAIGDTQGEIYVMLTKAKIDTDQPEKDHLGRAIPSGMYVCLEVNDNGCGMDDETKRRIFEPFYTTKFTGRGLGLSATLGIISGHDGALQLFSQPSKGTSFKIYLPALAKDSENDALHQQATASVTWHGSGTVLLVEDEEQVREIAKILLSAFGFKVIEAVNGREALDLYQKYTAEIKLVITDIGMPIMDGYELFLELRKLNPGLAIMISSGFGDKAIGSKIPPGDIAGIISKPYNLNQLQEALKIVVGGKRERILSDQLTRIW